MGKKISRYFQNFFYLVFKFFFICFHRFFKRFEAIIFTFLTVRYIQGQNIPALLHLNRYIYASIWKQSSLTLFSLKLPF